MTEYTVEVFKTDRRCKTGRKLIEVLDFTDRTIEEIGEVVKSLKRLGFVGEVKETYVTKRNVMTGEEYKERYDTPFCCSASSETYWSM